VLSWTIYHFLLKPEFGVSFSLLKQVGNLAVVIATFCFTMMTLLAGSVVIVLSIGKSRFYDQYKDNGYFTILMSVYFYALICLVINFFLSLLMFSNRPELFFNLTMAMAVNSMFHVVVLLLSFVRIHARSTNY
jgi:hypothetical protein